MLAFFFFLCPVLFNSKLCILHYIFGIKLDLALKAHALISKRGNCIAV